MEIRNSPKLINATYPHHYSKCRRVWMEMVSRTLREHLYRAYILICMTISMAQRLSAPTTRMIESIATHLAQVENTFSSVYEARRCLTALTDYRW
jgi:hypothetical protein